MGVDVADINADGLSDLCVTNFSMETNALYLGVGKDRFRESSRALGLGTSYVPLGFGVLFFDADLDADADLVVLNGHVNDQVEETDDSGFFNIEEADIDDPLGPGEKCEIIVSFSRSTVQRVAMLVIDTTHPTFAMLKVELSGKYFLTGGGF